MNDAEKLLKLAEYNSEVRETFEIIEDQQLEGNPQYFILYGMNEAEAFNPVQVFGLTDEQEVAQTIAHYRSTGLLRIREYNSADWVREYRFEQPKWVYVLKAEHIMHKITKFEQVETMK